MPTPANSAAQRSARARRAALTKNALAPDSMSRAREERFRLFERAVDPDEILEPDERQKRADRLLRAWLTDLGYQSSRKRRGQPHRKLVLAEWLEAATQKRTAAAPHDAATVQEEERDAAAPASKEERRVADVLVRS